MPIMIHSNFSPAMQSRTDRSTLQPRCHTSTCSSAEESNMALVPSTTQSAAASTASNDQYRVQRRHFQSPCLAARRCVSNCEAYGHVCPHHAQQAADCAMRHVQNLYKDSQLFVKEDNDAEPYELHCKFRVDQDDLKIGELLGSGGFCSVYACSLSSEPSAAYAAKTLRRPIMCDADVYKHGAADLAVEAHFLQKLSHHHIIRMHATPKGRMHDNISTGKKFGYFILLDRLVETLDGRIETWHMEQEKHQGNLLTRRTHEYKLHKRLELVERLRVAYAIADAMDYLHGLRIIYRDLKPDNIGFTSDGVLKLFDFGLAKELKPHQANESGMYVLSGNTGSRRYMDPNVAKGLPYNLSVDVYSFGIMLWEMCAAEKPFFEYTSGKHMQQVVLGGERPPMDAKHSAFWPLELQWLMTKCWSENPTQRPPFSVIKDTMREILIEKKLDSPARVISIGERQHPNVMSSPMLQPQNDFSASHGIASLFHRNKFHEVLLSPAQSTSSAPHAPSMMEQTILPPTAAFLSSLKPEANQGTPRAKTWGFMLRRNGGGAHA